MKKAKKVVALALCAVMLVVGSVAGTMAYLTSQDAVTNTFTVGNVVITLDEAKVDEYGVADTTADRVKGNTYKLIPGHKYTKDPIIHVGGTSEDCWLFVDLDNGLKNIIDATTIENQMTSEEYGWIEIDEDEQVYAYKKTVSKNENVPVFGEFKLIGTANVSEYAKAEIKVTAYAVQKDGFNDANAAWNATFGATTNEVPEDVPEQG